jgi:predicted TIM-barrel fold metal-dependent hydrolase
MIFDTHAHVMSEDLAAYPHSPLRGGGRPPVPAMTFPVERLVEAMDGEGIARACVVQRATLYGYDNSYVLAAAARYPARFSPVVVLDAEDPQSPATLTRLAAEHRLAGLRIVAPRLSEHDTDWLVSPQAMRLWEAAAAFGLPVAVILYRRNHAAGIAALAHVARRIDGIPIVFDHAALPHPSTPEKAFAAAEGIDYTVEPPPGFGIVEAIGAFADLPHVYFKITDINFDRLEEAGYDTAAFVRALADLFGAGRLVWGSDVGQSPAPYADKVARARHAAGGLDPVERSAFLGGNAARLYG